MPENVQLPGEAAGVLYTDIELERLLLRKGDYLGELTDALGGV